MMLIVAHQIIAEHRERNLSTMKYFEQIQKISSGENRRSYRAASLKTRGTGRVWHGSLRSYRKTWKSHAHPRALHADSSPPKYESEKGAACLDRSIETQARWGSFCDPM
jgi:hypothetical protein